MAASESTQAELEKYGEAQVPLPRIAIKFCVQCKWNLRAAYYAQELLSTFSTALGEVSLIPATGGTFTITLLGRFSPLTPPPAPEDAAPSTDKTSGSTPVREVLLWDRKTDGGFPEIKELKNRVRNLVEPGRDLGHVDRSLKKAATTNAGPQPGAGPMADAGSVTAGTETTSGTVPEEAGIED